MYIPDTKTIVEIKSLLSTTKDSEFPTIYSERANNQLKKIRNLLVDGYKVCYMLVSLNPYVHTISLSYLDSEFRNLFLECTNNGMTCMGISLKMMDSDFVVNKKVEIKGVL